MRSTLSDAKKIYVSFSGGADSLALLHRASTLFPEKIQAIHFEHGFRGGESLRDAAFCEKICHEWHIPLRIVPLAVPDHKAPGEGDEEAARRLRLAAWQQIVIGPEHAVVLLGHHADDALETLLMRLFRGSNASGLAALREKRVIGGITFFRPQLTMTRAEIEQYLHENGIREWCEDSTNRESLYLRNYLRNDLLPALSGHAPHAKGGMLRSLAALEADAELLEQMAEEAFLRCENQTEEWKKLPPALLVRVLRRFLGGRVPAWQAVERLQQELQKPYSRPVKIDLGQDIMLKRTKRTLEIVPADPEREIVWSWREEPECGGLHAEILPRDQVKDLTDGAAYFDAALMPEKLIIAPWCEGSRILSFDGKRKSLKKIFCDLHISGADRRILQGQDGTVYMAIGARNSAEARITEQTKTILRISGGGKRTGGSLS